MTEFQKRVLSALTEALREEFGEEEFEGTMVMGEPITGPMGTKTFEVVIKKNADPLQYEAVVIGMTPMTTEQAKMIWPVDPRK